VAILCRKDSETSCIPIKPAPISRTMAALESLSVMIDGRVLILSSTRKEKCGFSSSDSQSMLHVLLWKFADPVEVKDKPPVVVYEVTKSSDASLCSGLPSGNSEPVSSSYGFLSSSYSSSTSSSFSEPCSISNSCGLSE